MSLINDTTFHAYAWIEAWSAEAEQLTIPMAQYELNWWDIPTPAPYEGKR